MFIVDIKINECGVNKLTTKERVERYLHNVLIYIDPVIRIRVGERDN